MGTWQFVVDEPLKGFPVHAPPWSKTAKEYCGFKGKVRLFATVAGVPDEIPKGFQASIDVDIHWKKRARIDCSNILKGLEDGLFRRDRGIGEIRVIRRQHTGTEKVTVTVRFERETECGKSSTPK